MATREEEDYYAEISSSGGECDPEVFRNGKGICSFHTRSFVAEAWVQKVREESGQRVDWHLSGGYANVLYIGDYGMVHAAVQKLLPELEADATARTQHGLERFRIFDKGSHGLYRAGDL